MSYQLTVEPLGRTIEIREGQTILDACLREGIWLPHACGHGLCSSCKVTVSDGDVDLGSISPFALMEFEREEGLALACCATAQSDITIEADIDIDDDAKCYPVQDFVGRVSRIENLTPDIKGVWIALEGDGITFQPGQYINLNIPGVERPRAFSLANPASQKGEVELHIRLVPGGQGSSYVHTQLAQGDSIGLSGPYGQFFVRKSRPGPTLFLAGGSGLSSPKSMIIDLLDEGWSDPITLIHGVRTEQDIFFGDLFRDLAQAHPNFRYVPALSQPQSPDLQNETGWQGETGFVHEVAERLYNGKFSGLNAYLCGPPVMINACVDSLMKGRLFERSIFTERFISSADTGDGSAKSPLFRKV
jgi:phenol/toluene 2-monooxygenase (NADH) P5/A5